MKVNLKRTLLLGLFALALASCGSDKKSKNTTSTSANAYTNGFSNEQVSQVNQLESKYPCASGGSRTSIALKTQISGNYSGLYSISPGGVSTGHISGTVANVYLGRTLIAGDIGNDIVIVSKIVNSNSVTGFNITLRMCPMVLRDFGQGDINVVTDSTVKNVFIQQLTLDDNGSNRTGSVDYGHFIIENSHQYWSGTFEKYFSDPYTNYNY
ncbi:MAG: hypothetical protein H6622_06560 [Halobacteriovoraceae bacterium]|nr:hypothetical protein [Halobacteriovoraceae bacterium]